MKKDEIFEKIDNTRYLDRDLEHEMKESFISYAMAVNVSRAIPDVRDGLKPVHRRILYTMSELGLWSDKPFRKCAKIVGDVLGKYHPHGDSSVYDALVRLAQNFSINEPLVDGHGNFGSVDGDKAAAYRYTEARLSKIAEEMLRDIDKNTVDFYPNFDNTLMQPRVLPSRFPNILVNGSDGIAVGMATNIPPHNLGEVIDGVVALIDNPDITVDELINIIPAPDFPTGAQILGQSAIREAYKTGKGGIIIRAKAEIETFDEGKRYRIVVSEIPYQVNKSKLIMQIADLVKDKKIEGISNIRDESDKAGLRIVIEIKKDANPQIILNQLYKQSQLQVSDGIILLSLVDGQPKLLNLKEILVEYLKFQEEIITRRTQFDLDKAKEREHILEGLVIAVKNIDDVIKIIKSSNDKVDAVAKLIEAYNLSEKQANAILEMKLSRLTGLEIEKLNEELQALCEEIKKLTNILNNPHEITNIIKTELLETKSKYATPRCSEISLDYDDIDMGDLIEKHDVIISLTSQGYIKRMPVDEYRSQNRGGRGVVGHKAKDEDAITDMFACNSHDDLLFFSNLGKVYTMKAYEITEASRNSKGRALINLLALGPDEKINTMVKFDKNSKGALFMASSKGLIKKTDMSEFENIRKNGKYAIKFKDESDYLVSVKATSGDDELLLAANNGRCMRFSEKDVRMMSRTSHGVKGIKLGPDDKVIDMIVIDKNKDILTVTDLGFAKRTTLEDYRVQARRGKGLRAGKFNEKTGKLIAMKPITSDDDILAITSAGVVIRIHADQIHTVSRTSLGVRLMKTEDSKIVSVAIVKRQIDEDEFSGSADENLATNNLMEAEDSLDFDVPEVEESTDEE